MRRQENPELTRRILRHLADLYKIKEVREPNHLSTYVYCRTKAFLDQKQTIEPTDDEVMLFALGYGLQDVLTPKSAKAPVYEAEGIIYRPDMSFTPAPAEVEQLVELKTTRRSAKYHFVDEEIPETWLEYMMGGCHLRGTTQYDLIVLYMMGAYCLSPDTLVLMADLTWKEIGELKVGQELVGVDEYPDQGIRGWRRKLRRAAVTSIGTKILPARRLYLSNGTSVVSSTEHLWLKQRYIGEQGGPHYSPRWQSTQNLRVGDRIRQLCLPWETLTTYEAGWLAGVLDREGHVEGGHGLRAGFSQKDNIVALQARRILEEELDICMTESWNDKSGVCSFRITGMVETLRLIGSVRPARLLENLRWEGVSLPQINSALEIEGIDELEDTEVVAIGTSTKTLIANGLVSHNSPPFPQMYADTFFFSDGEIEANWGKLLQRKKVLDTAIATGQIPAPFQNNYAWECHFCRYKLVCTTIAQAQGLPIPEEKK